MREQWRVLHAYPEDATDASPIDKSGVYPVKPNSHRWLLVAGRTFRFSGYYCWSKWPCLCSASGGDGKKAIFIFQQTVSLDDSSNYGFLLFPVVRNQSDSTGSIFICVRLHYWGEGATIILCWHLAAGNRVHIRGPITVNFSLTPHGLLKGDILDLLCIWRFDKNGRLIENTVEVTELHAST